MTDAQYLAALFPNRYRVLGIRLEHFTLGHALLLERLESPFMVHSRVPGPGDLRLALGICSRRYPRAVRFANSRWLKWRLPMVNRSEVLPGAAQMFDYIREYQQHPECWSGRGGGRLMGTPFFQAVKLTHVMHLGKTESEALGTPLGLALWDYAACWELLEKMELVSGPDRQAMAAIEAMKRNPQPVNGNGR